MQQALSLQRWMWFASCTSLPSCHGCFRCSTLNRASNYDLGAWFLPQQSPLASASSHIQSWIWSATHTFLPSCHKYFECWGLLAYASSHTKWASHKRTERGYGQITSSYSPGQPPPFFQQFIWLCYRSSILNYTFRLWPTIIIHSPCSFISSGTIHYIHCSTHQNNMSTTIHIINDKCWSYKAKSCAPWFGWYCCQLIVYLLPSCNKCLRSGPSRP